MIVQRFVSIHNIPFDLLVKDGIKLFIFDADDTIAPYASRSLPKQTVSLFASIKHDMDADVMLISNTTRERRELLRTQLVNLGIEVATSGRKPDPTVFQRAFEHHRAKPDEVAMIGDRVGTDMWGAHLAGIQRLFLVKPYSSMFGGAKAPLLFRFLRNTEERLANV